MKNSFKQHIPGFVIAAEPPAELPFETTAELLALEPVRRFASAFRRPVSFVMHEDKLMLTLDDGSKWVVGYVAQPARVELPQWAGATLSQQKH